MISPFEQRKWDEMSVSEAEGHAWRQVKEAPMSGHPWDYDYTNGIQPGSKISFERDGRIFTQTVEYTKQQLIDKAKAKRESYRTGMYAEYLADPAGYEAKCRNKNHIDYISGRAEDGGFPAKLHWTDEQLYADEIQWESDIGPDGEVYSTYNPNSRWDWWVVGGRWGGLWKFKSPVDYDYIRTQESSFGMSDGAADDLATDCGRVGDIAAETIDSAWGYVDLDGQWHDKGKMGWWCMSDADESDDGELRWKKQYLDWVASLPKDVWVVNCDCHI